LGQREDILKLKKDMNAVILSHNYQSPEVQEIADFLGDSLDLCRRAEKTGAEYVVFCGVDFMAEAASILTGKKVLIPDKDARCPMASMLSAEDVRNAKKKHPGVPVVLYINTVAEAKAEADVICTSANMIEILNALPGDEVIFGPDCNMAYYAQKRMKKKIILVPEGGHCIVHKGLIPAKRIKEMMAEHPKAIVLAHPECNPDVQELSHHIVSTNGMVKLARELPGNEFIIATEEGLAYRLSKENPTKIFYRIPGAVCRNMKKTTLPKIFACMQNKRPMVEVPKEIAEKSRKAIQKMMDLSERNRKV
jgi:quinolinate synthase